MDRLLDTASIGPLWLRRPELAAMVSVLMQSLKRYTTREGNRMLTRTGQPFWQDESYDRLAPGPILHRPQVGIQPYNSPGSVLRCNIQRTNFLRMESATLA
jgi:hypothetical protein